MSDYLRTNDDVRVALIGPTFMDCRDTMVEGESGLLAVLPPAALRGGSRATAWNRSLGELFLANGSRAKCFSAEEPDRLRGPQHHRAWCDELAAWKYPDTWDQMMFGLRLGQRPQVVVTTTPKPVPLVKALMKAKSTVLTRGSTYDNITNLAPTMAAQILAKYEGTRLGRQELYAEILEDVEGALWKRDTIEEHRRDTAPTAWRKMVIGLDPADGLDTGDEQGLCRVGLGEADGEVYVLESHGYKLPVLEFLTLAVEMALEHGASITVEKNHGSAYMVEVLDSIMRKRGVRVPYRTVVASQGKLTRAEPVAMLYEQGKVHHVGRFEELEDQMTSFTGLPGDKSPDRLDSLVWACREFTQVGTATDYLSQLVAGQDPDSPPDPLLPQFGQRPNGTSPEVVDQPTV